MKLGQDYIVVENAIVVPPRRLENNAMDGKAGVFDAQGNFIEESVSIISGRGRHQRASLPEGDLSKLRVAAGTYVWGGVFFGHFGHFIVESMGRLWPVGENSFKRRHFLFVPKDKKPPAHGVARQTRLLKALGINVRISVAGAPLRVQRLVIPRQEFGLDKVLISGTPRYREFMRRSTASGVEAEGAEKVYISRKGLAYDRGTLLGERLIEEWLEAEGYRIFRPQVHSAEEQIAQYRAAKKIISVDCSPLHLLAYVARPDQKISMILRRPRQFTKGVEAHLTAFALRPPHIISALRGSYVMSTSKLLGRASWGNVDLCKVGAELAAQGMIDNPGVWRNQTSEERAQQITAIEQEAGIPYLYVDHEALAHA